MTAKVMRVEAFGAFAEIAPGIEGLVHVGELSGGKQTRHARELVKTGDTLELSVLSIDRERRRISLGTGNAGDEASRSGVVSSSVPSTPKMTPIELTKTSRAAKEVMSPIPMRQSKPSGLMRGSMA